MVHDTTPPGSGQRSYSMRKQPTQGRALATVDAILEAAARILVDAGYAAASTNHIADRAGVSVGSLYEYFPGKEAIFAELRRRELARWYAGVRQVSASAVTLRGMIRHLVTERIRYVVEHPELYVALETEVPRSAVAEVEDAVYIDYMRLASAYLEAHQSELRPQVPIDFLAEFLARWVNSTVHDFALWSGDELRRTRLAEELIGAIEHYLLADECVDMVVDALTS